MLNNAQAVPARSSSNFCTAVTRKKRTGRQVQRKNKKGLKKKRKKGKRTKQHTFLIIPELRNSSIDVAIPFPMPFNFIASFPVVNSVSASLIAFAIKTV